MQIDVFSPTGDKKKSLELPSSLFDAPVNWGLMHQAVVMQQNNRRQSPAHVLMRGEVWGSTKKLFQQKHTGRARRGDIRSPSLRGGGKAFGPRNDKNYTQSMPKKMRHAALRSCLALQASKGAIVAIEDYPNEIKTKIAANLLKKLPIDGERRVLFVTDAKHPALQASVRNLPRVKAVYASYLNAEDILNARGIVFLVDAIAAADAIFGKKKTTENKKAKNVEVVENEKPKTLKSKTAKKTTAPKAKKASSKSKKAE